MNVLDVCMLLWDAYEGCWSAHVPVGSLVESSAVAVRAARPPG